MVPVFVSINTHWDPVQWLKLSSLCVWTVCVYDTAAARRAWGYYWPAGLLWRPVVSEKSNICGVVSQTGFPLTVFPIFSPISPVVWKLSAWERWAELWKCSSVASLVFSNIGKHGPWEWNWFLRAVISWLIVQLPTLNQAHSGPSGCVSQRGPTRRLFTSRKHTFWGSI